VRGEACPDPGARALPAAGRPTPRRTAAGGGRGGGARRDLIGEVEAEQELGGGQQPLGRVLREQLGEQRDDVLALFRGSEDARAEAIGRQGQQRPAEPDSAVVQVLVCPLVKQGGGLAAEQLRILGEQPLFLGDVRIEPGGE
jgi:hypothetical protein